MAHADRPSMSPSAVAPRSYAMPAGCKVEPTGFAWDTHHSSPAASRGDISTDPMWPSDDAIKATAFEDARVAAQLLIQLQQTHRFAKAPVPGVRSVASFVESELHPWRSVSRKSRKRPREPSPSDLDMLQHERHSLSKAVLEAAAGTTAVPVRTKADPFASHRAAATLAATGVHSGDAIFRRSTSDRVRLSAVPTRRPRSSSSSARSRSRSRKGSDAGRRRRRRTGRPQNYVCGGTRDPVHFFLDASATHLLPQQYQDLKARVTQQSHSGKKGRYYSARSHVCTGCKEVFKGGAPLFRRSETVQDNLYRALRLQACLDVGMLPLAVGAGPGNHHNHNRDGHKETCAVANRMQRLLNALRGGVLPEGTNPASAASAAAAATSSAAAATGAPTTLPASSSRRRRR